MSTEQDLQADIDLFLQAKRCEEIEIRADRLSEWNDPATMDVLLYRLGDAQVQEDPDVEDAVCSALVKLGVMERRGNRNFRFRLREELSDEAQELVYVKHRQLMPSRYLK